MTFDFTTAWQDAGTAEAANDSAAYGAPRQNGWTEKPPAHPTSGELALLVRELFSEGSLTWDQLQALSRVAELRPVLEPTLDGVPACRRVSAHRQ